MRRRLRGAIHRFRKPKAPATDDDPQEERFTPAAPAARVLQAPIDSDQNQILEPAVANNAAVEPPQQLSPQLPPDRQLVIRSLTTNNVASTYVPLRRPAKRSDFSIAIICALPIEATAVDAIFDVYWDDNDRPYDKVAGDPNAYTTGAIGRHNVVLAHMPGMGKVSSALVAANCRHSFPNIKLALVVGVCGGVPSSSTQNVSTEIILGDVIISDGVIQYDLGRQYDDHLEIKTAPLDTLARPGLDVRSFLSQLKVPRQRKMLEEEMAKIMVFLAQSDPSAEYPGAARDKLYEATYTHIRQGDLCETCGCNGELVARKRLQSGTPQPTVHLGFMASGDRVVKSARYRDKIVAESKSKLKSNIIGFEMEGAGVWDTFPCVVIKAVCDYADSHKAKEWQPYAAATAAACMKAFLKKWTPSPSVHTDTSGPRFLVSYPRNNSFIGRSDVLTKLHQLPFNSTSQTRVALCGLGGIGKTQIAIEFMYWIKDAYPDMSVFWVHASNTERFREAYTSIAKTCEIPGHNDPNSHMLPLVKTWLESKESGQWIMAIDNADDLEPFFNNNGGLGRHLPECAHGTILITTRNLQVASRLTKGMTMSVIKIGKMDEDETAELLSTKLLETDPVAGDYAGLSARLEHLPLALVQAASFIQENSITISDYIQLLDESGQKVVDLLSQDFETVGRDSDTPHAVAETWIISFEQIQQRNTLAGELLSIMSFFDRQAIPYEFLDTYAEARGAEKLQLIKALGVLKAFSFVTEDKDQKFDMHRLVHLVTRKWLVREATMKQFAEGALCVVSECFPFGEYQNWAICNAYLPHASAVLELKEAIESKKAKLARSNLLHNTGRLFYKQGVYQRAETYQKEAWEIRQAQLGEEDTYTLTSMGTLASTYRSQGRWQEAESLEVQVLEIEKRVLGEDHPSTLTSMNNLALTYSAQGRYKEAESLNVQVLEIEKRVLGEDHPSTSITMHNLASTYSAQGRYKEAELLQVQVLENVKRVLGEDHPATLDSMHNLASSWMGLDRLDDALELFQECLRLGEKVFRLDNPDTSKTQGVMASLYYKQGRFPEAERLQVEVLRKRRRTLGEEHPHTLTSMHNLACTWEIMDRLEEAAVLMEDYLRKRQKVLGPNHQNTITSQGEMAAIYWKQHRFNEAEAIELEVLEKSRRILGEEHPNTLTSMHNLAYTWKDMGRLEEAIELMQDCIHLRQKVLGLDHTDTVGSLKALEEWLDMSDEEDADEDIDNNSETDAAMESDEDGVGSSGHHKDADYGAKKYLKFSLPLSHIGRRRFRGK
ncbi:hypothetical protein QBC41DRAFT_309154 [Cercophora samala]|uniref:Nucleoside phosphorylase domain-containing protein n=1 Tax=Cercophora samala TaxID=330535 RepID=A0AA40DGU7_9PEZI|nr:hypothetical protein QBC41DRAFT_309154 [Cercophora samala]